MSIVAVPPAVSRKPPGTLLVSVSTDGNIELFLRESEFGMRKYSRQVPTEVRLGVWEREKVLLSCFMLRIERNDLTTFPHWINPGEPSGIRFLKCLAAQKRFDIHFCLPEIARSIHCPNAVNKCAQSLLMELQTRLSWPPESFESERERMERLYPNAAALWWECAPPTE